MEPIILASRSPRRRQLLAMLNIPHTVQPAELDESRRAGETPVDYACRLASEKARSVAADFPGQLVLGADTTVVLAVETLGKPRDADEAKRMLARLSDRTHEVVSAIAVVEGTRLEAAVDVTRVTFRQLSEEFVGDYVATGEPLDKAGAYGIQGYGAALIERIEGDFFGVMGLPVRLVLDLLARFGRTYHFTR